MNKTTLCRAEGLAIGYGKTPLLRDIALGVKTGQILALIGPNGAGKSTLLRTLAGQLAPMGGAVLLDGTPLSGYTSTARARKLALMAPHSRRMELTTCFDFASAGRHPYTGRLGILSDEDRQQVRQALELVGAAALADRDFNRISDGQRQRVLLARALCQQPEVILLDEPTSFLDIKGKIELLTILQMLAHERGLAVVVSLHELELAQKIADRVVCVSPQGVSGVLSPAEAFAPERIRALYSLSEEQYAALYGAPAPAKPQASESPHPPGMSRLPGGRDAAERRQGCFPAPVHAAPPHPECQDRHRWWRRPSGRRTLRGMPRRLPRGRRTLRHGRRRCGSGCSSHPPPA